MPNLPQVIFGPEIWTLQNEGGISRYFQKLINGLSQFDITGQVLTKKNSNSRLETVDARNFKFYEVQNSKNFYGEISKKWQDDLNGNIFHPTYYSKNLVKFRAPKSKVVLTVFDMISEIFPEKKPRFRKSIDEKLISVTRADHILSISEHTKNDLISIYGVPKEKITVTYLGSDLHLFPEVYGVASAQKQFILYVGKRGGYKNFSNFVTAFSRSKFLMNNFEIRAVGGGSFKRDEMSQFVKLGIIDKIVQVEANDSKLSNLYRNAACLVYPSQYEGFGLPPIEAMSLNCPVIASNGGSIPEICKNAAEYFDPQQIDSIEHVVTKTLEDRLRLNEMRENGKLVSKGFTWDKTALETKNVYEKLID